MNWDYDTVVVANAAIVPAGSNGQVSVFASEGPTDLVIDIDGYFALPHSVNHARTPVTNLPPGQFNTVTVNWAFPFPDTNYTANCTPQNLTGGNTNLVINFLYFQVTAVNPSSVSVGVMATDGPNPINFTINCIGVHD